MGYLGFDPVGVARLRRALDDLDRERRRVSSTDPAAATALGRHRRAVTTLLDWRGRLDAVLTSSFADPYRAVALDLAVLVHVDVLRPSRAGWSVTTDPEVATPREPAPATRLGEWLAGADLVTLVGDPAALAHRLAELRRVTAEPEGVAALLDALGPAGLLAVAAALGDILAQHGTSAEATRQAAAAAPLLALVAGLVGAAERAGALDRSWLEALRSGDPYATALVVAHAGFATTTLARLVPVVWERWAEALPTTPRAPVDVPDLLLRALTADPTAGRLVLTGWRAPELLLGTGSGLGTARFLIAATDPRSGPEQDCLDALVVALTALHRVPGLAAGDHLDARLGAVVAPWLAFLVPVPTAGPAGAARAAWGEVDPEAVLRQILRHPDTLDDVAAGRDRLAADEAERQAAGTRPERGLEQLGVVLGTVDALLADAARQRRDRLYHTYERTWDAIGNLVAVPLRGLGAATRFVTSGPRWAWESADLPRPTDTDANRRREAFERSDHEAHALGTVAGALYRRALADGRLRAGDPPPAVPPLTSPADGDDAVGQERARRERFDRYRASLDRWVETGPPQERAARRELALVLAAFRAGYGHAHQRPR